MPTSFDDLLRRLAVHRNAREVAGAVGAVAVAWIVGKSIAGMKFGFPLMLVGALIFMLAFFRRRATVVLFPLVIALPNIGLDIPGPWAITVEDAFVLLIFSGYLVRAIIRREHVFPRDDAVVGPLFLFLAIAVLCLTKVAWVSPGNLLFNIKELMRLAMLCLCYLVLVDVLDTREQILRMVKWLLITSVWMMAVSAYIYLTLSPFWYDLLTMQPAYIFLRHKILRMVSIAGSTSYTGIYYASILALATHYAPLFATKIRRLWATALIGAILACVALTFNRGTWVGILLGLLILTLQGHIRRRRVVVGTILGLGLAFLAFSTVFGNIDIERQVVDFVYYSRSSATSRLVRWISAVNVILDHPLLGVGYNNYAFVFGRYSIVEGLNRMYGSPHNMFVDVITGTGIIGFVVFMTLLARLWRRMQDNLKADLPPDLKMLSRGIFLAFTFFLGSGLFDSFLFKPHHSSYVIVAVWAIATAIFRLRQAPPAPDAAPDPPEPPS